MISIYWFFFHTSISKVICCNSKSRHLYSRHCWFLGFLPVHDWSFRWYLKWRGDIFIPYISLPPFWPTCICTSITNSEAILHKDWQLGWEFWKYRPTPTSPHQWCECHLNQWITGGTLFDSPLTHTWVHPLRKATYTVQNSKDKCSMEFSSIIANNGFY